MATGKRETETQRFLSFVKLVFAVTAVVGVIVMAGPGPRAEAVALLNLWVDLVAGFFTVWGLVWAAQEFAAAQVRPQVHLLLGAERDFLERKSASSESAYWEWSLVGEHPCRVRGDQESLTLNLGLYLGNETTRAGRLVRLTVRVVGDPAPEFGEMVYSFRASGNTILTVCPPAGDGEHLGFAAQFAEELVVYECPVFVGVLSMTWDFDLPFEDLPGFLRLEYETYTLDGSFSGRVPIVVEWVPWVWSGSDLVS